MVEIHITRRPFVRWKSRDFNDDKTAGGLALAISTISGSTFNAYAKVLTTAFTSLSLMFVSELLTAFFILISYGFFPVCKKLVRMKSVDLRHLAVISFLNGVVGPLLLFSGIAYTTAVNAGFYSHMQIVFIVVLAAVILKERVTRAHQAAMLTIVFGTVFISLRGFTHGLTLQFGDILVIGSALGYGLGSVYYRKYLAHIEPHVALFGRSIVAIAAFFVVSPFLTNPLITQIENFPPALLPALLGFGFVSRFLNSVTFYQAVDRLNLTTVSLVGSLGIIGSTLFSYIYLHEPIVWFHFVGGGFIILGTLLVEVLGAHPNRKHLELHLKHRGP